MLSGVLAQVVAGAGTNASGCGNECEWLRVWVRGGITGKGRSGAALLERVRCVEREWATLLKKGVNLHYAKDENSHA